MANDHIIELRRVGNKFVAFNESVLDHADVFDDDWHRNYINNYCIAEPSQVDLFGRSDFRTVFVSQDDENTAFCVIDEGETGKIFELSSSMVAFSQISLDKYATSEAFYKPYALTIDTQILPNPIYNIIYFPHRLEYKRVCAESVVASRYNIILGAPGIGKTTFIRYLASSMLRQEFIEVPQTPIMILLRNFEFERFVPENLFSYLRNCETVEFAEAVIKNLGEGVFRFFLDGLDEVTHYSRDTIKSDIEEFVKQFPKNGYTITARNSLLTDIPEGAEVFQIGTWDDVLIRRWCFENLKEHGAWKKFYSLISTNSQDKELFKNPLMLNLAAYLFEQYGMFPHRKVDLLFNVLNALIDDWDKTRNIKRSSGFWMSPRHKLSILAYIAYNQAVAKDVSSSEETIQGWIGERTSRPSPEMCRALAVETGLLTEISHGQWKFVHKTIQEYLAAAFIADSSLRPMELLVFMEPEEMEKVMSYLPNMVSDNKRLTQQILNENSIEDITKGRIFTTALSEGMELDAELKKSVYALVGLYLKSVFREELDVDLHESSLELRGVRKNEGLKIRHTLGVVARVAMTRFSDELRDIAAAVLPHRFATIIDFVLGSASFFIDDTKSQVVNCIDDKTDTF